MSATLTNCPKCNAATGGLDECPQCGILFSKWQIREDNVATGNLSRYTIANATSTTFNWIILGIVTVVVIVIFFYIDKAKSQ